MRVYETPETICRGQLPWLMAEVGGRPVRIACRVFRPLPRERFEVEVFASEGELVVVHRSRLLAEKAT